jgi:hypothetical protein
MVRPAIFLAMLGVAASANVVHAQPAVSLADLAWVGPKTYSSGSIKIPFSGHGILPTGGVIDELPGGTGVVTITRMLTNAGTVPVPAGYTITETVVALNVVAGGGSFTFIPVVGPPVATLTMSGPALAPHASVPIKFTIPVPKCGLYEETLDADATDIVAETNKANNVAKHYFGLPGAMRLQITVRPLNLPIPNREVEVWHGPRGGIPNRCRPYDRTIDPQVELFGLGPALTHAFRISRSNPATMFYFNYERIPQIGSLNSVDQLIGPAPVQPPAPPVVGPAPIIVQNRIGPTNCIDNAPSTDITTLNHASEKFHAVVTAITADACFIRQNSADVRVWHPAR